MTDQLKEDVFGQLFASGAVRYVDVHISPDGRAMVLYTMQNGVQGFVHTKRGQVKLYKPETALRLLRTLGLVTVKVEMKDWNPAVLQGSLL